MKYEAKEKPLKTKRLFASVTYYKLQARKHFVYYVIGLGSKGYRVGGVEEILDKALMIPGCLVARKPWGRSRSSWLERACAVANAMAAP